MLIFAIVWENLKCIQRKQIHSYSRLTCMFDQLKSSCSSLILCSFYFDYFLCSFWIVSIAVPSSSPIFSSAVSNLLTPTSVILVFTSGSLICVIFSYLLFPYLTRTSFPLASGTKEYSYNHYFNVLV